jgi:hypothetical protein
MPILKQALQTTAAQEAALNDLESAFNRAANGLSAACSDGMPRKPSARLQAIEARLDMTWVAVQTIEVAVHHQQRKGHTSSTSVADPPKPGRRLWLQHQKDADLRGGQNGFAG